MPRRSLVTGNASASLADRGPDFNQTPFAALAALLLAERRRMPKRLWEPACGNGRLVVPLRRRGYDVTATDLHSWGCPEATTGVDFLEAAAAAFAPQGERFGIVTNPPFSLDEEFIERAVGLAPYVAMLLRFSFLESEGRHGWWRGVGLRRVHLIVERLPMMHRHGYEGPKLDKSAMAFAWFIFCPGLKPRRSVPVSWVSWKEACKRFPEGEGDTPPNAAGEPSLFAWPG